MGRARTHIVDELIEERAPRLAATPAWPVLRPALYQALGYRKAVSMADAIRDLPGGDALDHVSRLLALNVTAEGLDRLPPEGRCLVICNHPTGIADGVAVRDAIARIRSDAIFFANADALRVCPRFGEALIPVEWVETKRTREKTRATLTAAREAFEAERCVVIFPAGRLARKVGGELRDPPWAATAVSLAQKYAAPIVPVHVSGPYSHWFHGFDKVSPELRDITLFHELLNKSGQRFSLRFGPPVPPSRLEGAATDLTEALKSYVERDLRRDINAVFQTP